MTTKPSKAYRAILQSIVCQRFADRDAALLAIDVAFERREISQLEARKLEGAVK